jgi:hypothetical protein
MASVRARSRSGSRIRDVGGCVDLVVQFRHLHPGCGKLVSKCRNLRTNRARSFEVASLSRSTSNVNRSRINVLEHDPRFNLKRSCSGFRPPRRERHKHASRSPDHRASRIIIVSKFTYTIMCRMHIQLTGLPVRRLIPPAPIGHDGPRPGSMADTGNPSWLRDASLRLF